MPAQPPYPYNVQPVMEGTQAVEIPVLAKGDLVAGEALFQCAIVALDSSSGKVMLADSGDKAIYGIAMWDAAIDGPVTVLCEGTGWVIASGTILAGQAVGYGATSGYADVAAGSSSGGTYVLGIAQTYGIAGQRVKVLIKPSGMPAI
jgi:hypothetical protein